MARFAMRWPFMQKIAFRAVSQTAFVYRASKLSQGADWLPDPAPRAGDRFPWLRLRLRPDGPLQDLYQSLDDRRFHLFVFGQELPEGMLPMPGSQLCVHVVPRGVVNDSARDRAGIPAISYFLVRPDGHVGLCGTRLRARTVEAYLRERLGIDFVDERAAAVRAGMPETADMEVAEPA
jgi:hypothetical protein